MTNLELTLKRVIPASAQKVFNAWLDPDKLACFMKPAAGMSVPKAEVDAQVGGEFLIVMQAGEQEMPHHGSYTKIDKYKTLAFTWFSHHAKAGSLVTLSFNETAPHVTELTLHHTGFENEEMRNNHEGGWGAILSTFSESTF